MAPMESRVLYSVLVLLAALARLAELRVAARHRRALLARGAREVGAGHYPWMVALHAGWLAACVLEGWLGDRPWSPLPGGIALAFFLAAMGLRYWVIATLGERWTTRILVLPGAPLVTGGPFRFLRHPNYLAVAIEIAALPLVHGAWWTAVAFTLANGLLLRVRIASEEAALAAAAALPAA